jgi:membrane associated rhomboid family serine protease
MNKKLNTFLFILGATVVNLLIVIALFLLLLFLFVQFLAPLLAEEVAMWGTIFTFVVAVALSFIIYQALIKQLTKRIDMNKYFDPIFAPRRRPPVRKD